MIKLIITILLLFTGILLAMLLTAPLPRALLTEEERESLFRHINYKTTKKRGDNDE